MKGSVQQPIPEAHTDQIPTDIVDGESRKVLEEAKPAPTAKASSSQLATRMAKTSRALNIFNQDVHKYGRTPGYQACTEGLLRRKRGKGVSQHMPPDCRARMKFEIWECTVDAERVISAEGED